MKLETDKITTARPRQRSHASELAEIKFESKGMVIVLVYINCSRTCTLLDKMSTIPNIHI
jgi:hypothetical protein